MTRVHYRQFSWKMAPQLTSTMQCKSHSLTPSWQFKLMGQWQVCTLGTFFCRPFIAKRHPENVEVTSPITQSQLAEGELNRALFRRPSQDYSNCRPAAGSLATVPGGGCQLALLITCRPGWGGKLAKGLKRPRQKALEHGRLAYLGSRPPCWPHGNSSAVAENDLACFCLVPPKQLPFVGLPVSPSEQ